MAERELKFYWPTGDLQLREEGGDTPSRILSGTVFRYGDIARVIHRGAVIRERVERGAVQGNVAELDIIANLQHQRARAVARTPNGVVLVDSPTELRAEIVLGEDTDSLDAYRKFKSGILRGLSAEFWDIKSEVIDGILVRQQIELDGIGIVDKPAFEGSVLDARALEIRQLTPVVATRNPWW